MGKRINSLRFTDDVILTDAKLAIQKIRQKLEFGLEGYGMKTNMCKTKMMRANYEEDMSVEIYARRIRQVVTY